MASTDNVPREVQWDWSGPERARLRRCFQHGLIGVLQAVEKWTGTVRDEGRAPALKALADRLEAAGADLDVCAANCHALATTLRAQLGTDGVPPVSASAGVRLSRALGSPVVLTRTTIEQLVGKTLRLEYIEGTNAIVQINGEYWGTPLDRVLVLQDATPPEPDQDALRAPPSGPAPAFVFVLRQGELSNAIQFLAMTARDGVLRVTAEKPGVEGLLSFASRRVTHAEFGTYTDVDAVARMMLLPTSRGVFRDGPPAMAATMHMSTDQLLIEAAVKADECGQARDGSSGPA